MLRNVVEMNNYMARENTKTLGNMDDLIAYGKLANELFARCSNLSSPRRVVTDVTDAFQTKFAADADDQLRWTAG